MICPKISIGIKFSLGLKKDFCFLWLSYLPFILVPSPSCPSPSPNLGEAHLDNMHWFQYVTEFGVNLLYNTHFHIKKWHTLSPCSFFFSWCFLHLWKELRVNCAGLFSENSNFWELKWEGEKIPVYRVTWNHLSPWSWCYTAFLINALSMYSGEAAHKPGRNTSQDSSVGYLH